MRVPQPVKPKRGAFGFPPLWEMEGVPRKVWRKQFKRRLKADALRNATRTLAEREAQRQATLEMLARGKGVTVAQMRHEMMKWPQKLHYLRLSGKALLLVGERPRLFALPRRKRRR